MRETQTSFRRNYIAHCMTEGFLMGGLAFVTATTVLPPLIKSLGGPSWLISLMPIMLMLGIGWSPLFTAHRIERLRRLKPVVLVTALLQRLLYLGTAFILFYLAEKHRLLTISAVALTPFFFGFFGGITITAWQGLIAKTIPANRRSSLWALQSVISSPIGIGAGVIIALVLDKFPGTQGYGILHLITFAFLMFSFLSFLFLREDSAEPPEGALGLVDNLKQMPMLVKKDKRLLWYLISRSLMSGIFIMTPFLSIHALRVTNRQENYLGFLVMAQMIGGLIGNVAAGLLGDKYGGKIVMALSRVGFLMVCILAILARTEWAFFAVFFLYGVSSYSNLIGTRTLNLEMCPVKKRPTYLAIMSAVSLPSMLAASSISALTWNLSQNFGFMAILSFVAIGISALFLLRVQEPRTKTANP